MKILIGTTNPGKIQSAKLAFENYFENVLVEGIKVPSLVSAQPVNKDIYLGAKNRVKNLIDYATKNKIDADYFVAVESGICDSLGKWQIVNMACIVDKKGYESWGSSAGFPVPNKYVDEIIKTELGSVMDKIFTTNDLRSSVGGISYLTHEKISRIDLGKDAFVMALTQFINGNIWHD